MSIRSAFLIMFLLVSFGNLFAQAEDSDKNFENDLEWLTSIKDLNDSLKFNAVKEYYTNCPVDGCQVGLIVDGIFVNPVPNGLFDFLNMDNSKVLLIVDEPEGILAHKPWEGNILMNTLDKRTQKKVRKLLK